MAEIANRIYKTSEGQILFLSDFSDINDNEKVVSRALSVEEKKAQGEFSVDCPRTTNQIS